MKEGSGVITFENNSVFSGIWKNDKAFKEGVLKMSNRDVYKGNYADS